MPLHGNHRALTTGPLGKSHDPHFNIPSYMLCTCRKHQSPLCIGSLKGSLQGHRYGNKIVTWDKCPVPSTSVQFSSVTQWCPTLHDPMDCSTPGFPVYHQPLELAQTHVHQVSDVIQPSHPLSSPSPPAFKLPQHQGLLQ